jgi:hypothetical protein
MLHAWYEIYLPEVSEAQKLTPSQVQKTFAGLKEIGNVRLLEGFYFKCDGCGNEIVVLGNEAADEYYSFQIKDHHGYVDRWYKEPFLMIRKENDGRD